MLSKAGAASVSLSSLIRSNPRQAVTQLWMLTPSLPRQSSQSLSLHGHGLLQSCSQCVACERSLPNHVARPLLCRNARRLHGPLQPLKPVFSYPSYNFPAPSVVVLLNCSSVADNNSRRCFKAAAPLSLSAAMLKLFMAGACIMISTRHRTFDAFIDPHDLVGPEESHEK